MTIALKEAPPGLFVTHEDYDDPKDVDQKILMLLAPVTPRVLTVEDTFMLALDDVPHYLLKIKKRPDEKTIGMLWKCDDSMGISTDERDAMIIDERLPYWIFNGQVEDKNGTVSTPIHGVFYYVPDKCNAQSYYKETLINENERVRLLYPNEETKSEVFSFLTAPHNANAYGAIVIPLLWRPPRGVSVSGRHCVNDIFFLGDDISEPNNPFPSYGASQQWPDNSAYQFTFTFANDKHINSLRISYTFDHQGSNYCLLIGYPHRGPPTVALENSGMKERHSLEVEVYSLDSLNDYLWEITRISQPKPALPTVGWKIQETGVLRALQCTPPQQLYHNFVLPELTP